MTYVITELCIGHQGPELRRGVSRRLHLRRRGPVPDQPRRVHRLRRLRAGGPGRSTPRRCSTTSPRPPSSSSEEASPGGSSPPEHHCCSLTFYLDLLGSLFDLCAGALHGYLQQVDLGARFDLAFIYAFGKRHAPPEGAVAALLREHQHDEMVNLCQENGPSCSSHRGRPSIRSLQESGGS